MKNVNKTHKIFVFLFVVFALSSCSKDDDKNGNDNDLSNNQVSFTISGDVEGDKKGYSSVVTVEGGTTSYVISNHDGNSYDDQTFSLTFYKSFTDDSISNPPPGTYPIAGVVDLISKDGFWVVYTDVKTGKEYGGNGTLTISKSSGNELKGTFEFTGNGIYGSEGNIKITNGKFSAAID